jgi:hypothetical protein
MQSSIESGTASVNGQFFCFSRWRFWLVQKMHWVLQTGLKWCEVSHKLKCLKMYIFKFLFISRITRFWSFWKNILICATLHITWDLFVKFNAFFEPIKIFNEKNQKKTVHWPMLSQIRCSSVEDFRGKIWIDLKSGLYEWRWTDR